MPVDRVLILVDRVLILVGRVFNAGGSCADIGGSCAQCRWVVCWYCCYRHHSSCCARAYDQTERWVKEMSLRRFGTPEDVLDYLAEFDRANRNFVITTSNPGDAFEVIMGAYAQGDDFSPLCWVATTGGARPTREDALRWVHDNAMGDGSCAPLAATLAGDVLRTAAYTLWKAARKLRWVGKGINKGRRRTGDPAASGGRRSARGGGANGGGGGRRACSPHEMTAPRRRVATSSPVQQPGPCRALSPTPTPLPAQAYLHGRTTGRCPAQLIFGRRRKMSQSLH
jgi:hypothetical protein